MNFLLKKLSQAHSWPIVGPKLKADAVSFDDEEVSKFLKTQRLALSGAKEVEKILRPGITEKKAALLLDTYLLDHGVENFFHYSFAWFGNRTKFEGMNTYFDFLPSDRCLEEGDVVILDTAPVLNGYPADIGYSFSLGKNEMFDSVIENLKRYRQELPKKFFEQSTGSDICKWMEAEIRSNNLSPIYRRYPLEVLGHRLYPMKTGSKGVLRPFSWAAYRSLIGHGLFSEALNHNHQGQLDGLWAIEPHVGSEKFGAKFEEMLWVRNGSAQWIETKGMYYGESVDRNNRSS